MALNLYNSLSKNIEVFSTISGKSAGVYTCGPTVYSFVTIGNWRTYVLADIIVRTLRYNGYQVDYFMNITDVGHLTGDNSGDADTGEDRLEKAKQESGKSAWDIASFYTENFKAGSKILNIIPPQKYLVATEHIEEQINLVKKLESRGLTYKISDGIYFDTEEYEKLGFKYGELSNLDAIKAGARVEFNTEKKNARDFALWKFSPTNVKRDMEWESPWGIGFPGWHIECSAMSTNALGEQFDLHIGGEDLKSTHHPNEIAQSQGATGKSPFARFWAHGAFLQVNGGRMGKSLGNAFTIEDITAKNIDPLALRYFYFTGHYRSPINFTWEGLQASSTSLSKIKKMIWNGISSIEEAEASGNVDENYKVRFLNAINDDLNMPVALSILHELAHDTNIFPSVKLLTALNFDEIFGFSLGSNIKTVIPDEIILIAQERQNARAEKNWAKSDELRDKINELGFLIKDEGDGFSIESKN